MKLKTFTAITCLTLAGSGVLAAAEHAPPIAETNAQSETFLRVSTVMWNADFNVAVQQLPGQDAVRVELTGTMWDALGQPGQAPETATNASITLTIATDAYDLAARDHVRALRTDAGVQLYLAEPIGPKAAIWSSVANPSLGNIEVWNGDAQGSQLEESVVLALFRLMVDPTGDTDDTDPVDCDPTFGECATLARTTCGEAGVASFSYSCTSDGATCSFTCHPANEPPVGTDGLSP